jgi:hypothetical protein
VGTHGRNAITINGVHTCCEQSLDGHNACCDFEKIFFADIFDESKLQTPTMFNTTDECEQEYFAHIDYDRKIAYFSCEHPLVYILSKYSEYQTQKDIILNGCDLYVNKLYSDDFKYNINMYNNLTKRQSEGWIVLFTIDVCPLEYDCINRVNETIEDVCCNYQHLICKEIIIDNDLYHIVINTDISRDTDYNELFNVFKNYIVVDFSKVMDIIKKYMNNELFYSIQKEYISYL